MNTETNFIIADDQAWFRKNLINLLKDYQIRAIGEASNGLEVIELLKIEVPGASNTKYSCNPKVQVLIFSGLPI